MLDNSDLDLSVLWPIGEVVDQEPEDSNMLCDKLLMQCTRELDFKTYSDQDNDIQQQSRHEEDLQTGILNLHEKIDQVISHTQPEPEAL